MPATTTVKIDWRDLLRRYLEHVEYAEGTTFLSALYRKESASRFSDAEWAALRELSEEPYAPA